MATTHIPEYDKICAAAMVVVHIHQSLADFLKAGVTLAQIDQHVGEQLAKHRSKSCFLHYAPPGYPKFPSYSCLSPNDVIVHGTAGMTTNPLKPGDIISIDIGSLCQGWIGDAAWTYAIEAFPSDDARKLYECGKESLRLGIEQLQPGAPLLNWARAVQTHVEQHCGFYLTRGLGGHGYRRNKLHWKPYVSNVVPGNAFEWSDASYLLLPGDTIAVEPMVAIGSSGRKEIKRKWPISTPDGSLAVHFEHDILITDNGPEVLTAPLDDLPAVVG